MILKRESDSPRNENCLTLDTTTTFILLGITTPSFWWFDMRSILLAPCFQPRNWLQSEGKETNGWSLKECTVLITSLITHNYGKLKKKKKSEWTIHWKLLWHKLVGITFWGWNASLQNMAHAQNHIWFWYFYLTDRMHVVRKKGRRL